MNTQVNCPWLLEVTALVSWAHSVADIHAACSMEVISQAPAEIGGSRGPFMPQMNMAHELAASAAAGLADIRSGAAVSLADMAARLPPRSHMPMGDAGAHEPSSSAPEQRWGSGSGGLSTSMDETARPGVCAGADPQSVSLWHGIEQTVCTLSRRQSNILWSHERALVQERSALHLRQSRSAGVCPSRARLRAPQARVSKLPASSTSRPSPRPRQAARGTASVATGATCMVKRCLVTSRFCSGLWANPRYAKSQRAATGHVRSMTGRVHVSHGSAMTQY